MECHDSTKLAQPIEQNSNIAIADKNFGELFHLHGQIRKQLNRAEAAAGAKDRIDIAAAKKLQQILSAQLGIAGQITANPSGGTLNTVPTTAQAA